MTQKLAVLFLHGAGTPKEDFADEMIKRIRSEFAKKLPIDYAAEELVFHPVFWSSIFAPEQKKLWNQLLQDTKLSYHRLRRFVIEFLADAIAYQPTAIGGQNYDKIHAYVAKSINDLKEKAGRTAPLCVISHSLGSVVASNYFYDLQSKRENIGAKTKQCKGTAPIEQCQTLTLFYTMGSPLVLWSLRYLDFGSPITVPAPMVKTFYPKIQGEWLNFYDKDDVLAFPLKGVNSAYEKAVTADVPVNAGGILTNWTPLSHRNYDTDSEVINPIVDGLIRTWWEVNG